MREVRYNISRMEDAPTELYQLELWERQPRSQEYYFTETVQDDLTLEQAKELRTALIKGKA
jgi:hypothetical protein